MREKWDQIGETEVHNLYYQYKRDASRFWNAKEEIYVR